MMPFFFLAMYEKNGQPLEVIMRHMVQSVFIRPKIRPYKTDNYYEVITRYAVAKEGIDKIISTHTDATAGRKQTTAGRNDKEKIRK